MEYKKSAEKENYKVSVIVPVYNVEDYLEECVNSLLRQTLTDIEILLIDDGSTDSSGDICDGFKDKYRNVSVIHKDNEGQGKARNIGLLEVGGKYLYYMDSDDLLEADALKFLYDEAEQKKLDVIMFSAECFSDDNEIDYDPLNYKRTAFLNEVRTGKDMFANLYSVHEYYCSIPMRFYKREYLIENKFVFPEHIIHEDEIFGFLSLILANRVECVPFQFYKRRFRQGSTMTSKKAYDSAVGYLYTWKALKCAFKDMDVNEEKIYSKFANDFFALARNLYYTSFDNKEKNRFVTIRNELINLHKKEHIDISKGEKFFLVNPFLYKQYKKILKFVK